MHSQFLYLQNFVCDQSTRNPQEYPKDPEKLQWYQIKCFLFNVFYLLWKFSNFGGCRILPQRDIWHFMVWFWSKLGIKLESILFYKVKIKQKVENCALTPRLAVFIYGLIQPCPKCALMGVFGPQIWGTKSYFGIKFGTRLP